MKIKLIIRGLSLVPLLANQAMASTAVTPWIIPAQTFVTALTSGWVPIITAMCLLMTLFAYSRYGDSDEWIGKLLKYGIIGSAAANVVSFSLFFTGGGVAAATLTDVVDSIPLSDWE